MKFSNVLFMSGLSSLALLACGGDDTKDSSTSASSTSTSTSSTASGAGGAGGDAATTAGQGGATTTAGAGGAGTTASSSSTASASSASSSTGGGDPTINGCTLATATDKTNLKSVDVTAVSPWDFGHHACIVVTAGTQIVFNGNFTTHPLKGGVSPTVDANSPITQAKPSGMTETIVLPVDPGKAYPYFCGIHVNMQGVIYVK